MSKLKINMHGKRALRDKEAEGLIRRAARAAWESFDYPFNGEVDITLTDNEGIREINREYREIDSATDVLSFPIEEFFDGNTLMTLIGQRLFYNCILASIDPETGMLALGDMIISVERAREQAGEYGHSFDRECAYLTVHSMLHLVGYDHLDEGEQKKRMRHMEETVMTSMGLERE